MCVASDSDVGIGGTKSKLYGTEDIAVANQINGTVVATGGDTRGGGASGDESKQSSSNAKGGIGGGSYYAARGINLLSLEDLMEGMKSAFRVVQG